MANPKKQATPEQTAADDQVANELRVAAQEEAAKKAKEEAAQREFDKAEEVAAEAETNATTQGEATADQIEEAEQEGPVAELNDLDTVAIPETLFVQDLTSKKPDVPRIHTLIIDGKPVNFPFLPGERVEMPFMHAAKFLIDPAFIVTDHDGKRYEPAPKRISASELKELRASQVIADLGELSTEALFLRAVKFPDGEKLNRATSRDNLIEFLKTAHEVVDRGQRAAEGKLFKGNSLAEDMDAEQVKTLLAV